MTEFKTQIGGGAYRLQFETDREELWRFMQEMARKCLDADRPEWTRADKLRVMTDQQIAQAAAKMQGSCPPDALRCGAKSCEE